VLFNIAGGYDMSMHEINEAAEVITNAVAPDANIIFGATLKPELEDELVITVIATGFDSAYFQARNGQAKPEMVASTASNDNEDAADGVEEEDINKLDMDLDDEPKKPTFTDEDEPKNIWNYDDESDTPAFLRRRKKDDDE
jgi:cell division protein FtsZ